MKTRLKKILAVTLAVLLLHTSVCFLVTKLVYDGIFSRYDYVPAALAPEFSQMQACQVQFPSGENLLSGRLFNSPGDGLVVIVQGLNSHMEYHYPTVLYFLEQAQLDVFIFDMTGSCNSQGNSTVGLYQAVTDLCCALDYIGSAYDYEDIFLFGHSRGAYAACCSLAQRQDVDGVVAVNGPNSAMEVVVGSAAARVGPLAYLNYPMLWLYQCLLFGQEAVELSAAEVIEGSDVPVLIIQARQDTVVPADSFSIYAHRQEISRENAEFLLLDGQHSTVLQGDCPTDPNLELMTAAAGFFSGSR